MLRAFLILFLGLASGSASAASLSFLDGNSYKNYAGETVEKEIITIDHFAAGKYGAVYFYYDISYPRRKDDHAEFFGSISPTLSFSKITGRSFSYGVIQDVSLKLELEHVSAATPVYYYGFAFDLKLPHFSFAQVSIVLRDDPNKPGVGGQFNGAWSIPVGWSRLTQFAFQGFWAAGVIPEAQDKFFLTSQPQFLYDLSPVFATDPGSVQAGIEYSIGLNRYLKAGVIDAQGKPDPGFDERVIQAMVKVNY